MMSNATASKLLKILAHFKSSIRKCHNLQELDGQLHQAITRLNCNNYIYAYYSKTLPAASDLWHAKHSPSMKQWFEFFHQGNYLKANFAGRKAIESAQPFTFNLKKDLEKATHKSYRQFIKAALNHGINSCAIFILFSSKGGVALLSIYHDDIETLFKKTPFLPVILNQIGLLYHYQVSKQLSFISQEKNTLTPRQIECLILTAQNKESKEIAKLIKRSKRTVDFHLSNVNRKLGTKNKYQAVAKALALGLIKI